MTHGQQVHDSGAASLPAGAPLRINPGSLPTSAFDILCALAGCDLPERQTLERALRPRRLVRGERLFEAGVPLPEVFVPRDGVIKLVYETVGGDAWVKAFVTAGQCFASVTALSPGGRSSFAAVAETAAMVDVLPYAALQDLACRHAPWQRALTQAFRLYGERKERREMQLLTLTPEQRYECFLREQPQLAALLKQRDIASYIRITPVALSRIKARLAKAHADAAACTRDHLPQP
jgi:CRP-like cAMP-binding protein